MFVYKYLYFNFPPIGEKKKRQNDTIDQKNLALIKMRPFFGARVVPMYDYAHQTLLAVTGEHLPASSPDGLWSVTETLNIFFK